MLRKIAIQLTEPGHIITKVLDESVMGKNPPFDNLGVHLGDDLSCVFQNVRIIRIQDKDDVVIVVIGLLPGMPPGHVNCQ